MAGVEVAKAFVTVIPSMQGSQAAITKGMTGAMSTAGTAGGNAAGTAASAGIAARLSKFVAPAAVLAAFAVLGKQCADSFAAVEEGTNAVLTATGATGEQAEQLIDVYKNVAQNVAGDFDEIGAAVGELNTRFGLTGDALEAASEETMKYAKVAGVDAVDAVAAVSRMMNNAGIDASQYGEYLDKLTVAAQQSGIDVNKLAESVTNNAASFRQLGFSTDEAIAMLANFEKAGVPASQVLSGMKKGVAEWTAQGKSASEGWQEFISGIQDGSVTAQDAMDLFGRRAGSAMYDAAMNGQLDFQEMYAAITEGSDGALDSVYNDTLTLSDKLGIIKNNFMEAGASVAEPFVDLLSQALTGALPLIQGFADGVGFMMDTLSTTMAPAAEALGSLFSGIMESGAAETLLQSIGNAFATIANIVGSVLTPVIQILSPIIGILFEVWANGISIVLNFLSALASEIASAVMPYIQQLAAFLSPYLEQLKSWFEQNLPAIQSACSTVISGIMSFVQVAAPIVVGIVTGAVGAIKRIIGTIVTIVSVVQNIFNRVKMAILNPIEAAKNAVKRIVDTIKGFFNFSVPKPNIPLPHFKISPSGWKVGDLLKGSIPSLSVQWYAKGGIFTAPQLIGVGEAGTEVVMPLSRLEDMLETDGGGDTFNLYINGTQMMSDEAIETRFYSLMDGLLMRYKLMRGH